MRIRKFPKNPYLRALLPAVRSIEAARRELRWLKQELPEQRLPLKDACRRRGRGEPLQYILGTQSFGELNIECRRKVLIPRWETEEWVLELSSQLQPGTKVLDLCTGTGCILFLLVNQANVEGVGVDLSPHACRLFLKNREKFGMEASTKVAFQDIFKPLGIKADVVVANPPYINRLNEAHASVLWEPRLALIDPGHIYDAVIRRIVEADARKAVIEVGSLSQAQGCQRQLELYGWKADIRTDSAGHVRTVWAVRANT